MNDSCARREFSNAFTRTLLLCCILFGCLAWAVDVNSFVKVSGGTGGYYYTGWTNKPVSIQEYMFAPQEYNTYFPPNYFNGTASTDSVTALVKVGSGGATGVSAVAQWLPVALDVVGLCKTAGWVGVAATGLSVVAPYVDKYFSDQNLKVNSAGQVATIGNKMIPSAAYGGTTLSNSVVAQYQQSYLGVSVSVSYYTGSSTCGLASNQVTTDYISKYGTGCVRDCPKIFASTASGGIVPNNTRLLCSGARSICSSPNTLTTCCYFEAGSSAVVADSNDPGNVITADDFATKMYNASCSSNSSTAQTQDARGAAGQILVQKQPDLNTTVKSIANTGSAPSSSTVSTDTADKIANLVLNSLSDQQKSDFNTRYAGVDPSASANSTSASSAAAANSVATTLNTQTNSVQQVKVDFPDITEQVHQGTKEALADDQSGVTKEADPAPPDKKSLTTILNTFMQSWKSLPIISLLTGYQIQLTGGVSTICMGGFAFCPDTNCVDFAQWQSVFIAFGNALYSLVAIMMLFFLFAG